MHGHCRRCGAPIIQVLSPTGRVIQLDTQVSFDGAWRLRTGPGEMAFALKDPAGPGERYTRHDGNTCRGETVGGAPYRE
jgi:hypothetical protein